MPSPSVVRPPWFSNPVRTGRPSIALGLGHHFAHRPRAGSLHRLDVEQTHALVRLPVGSGKAPPHHLEAGAHREHHRAACHPPGQRPVLDEAARRPNLWAVLATAEAIDVRLGERAVRDRLQQLGMEAPPLGPADQDEPVSPVPVGAQQVGVDHRHTQRSAHPGAPSRSWNAV